MKTKNRVGLFGNLTGLKKKLSSDLSAIGLSPFAIDSVAVTYPIETKTVICTNLYDPSNQDERRNKLLSDLGSLIGSLKRDQSHLIFVSIAATNRPETTLSDIGHLNLKAEKLVQASGLNYTIVRVMSADDRPGRHHKLYWSQDLEEKIKSQQHPVPWEDISQVIVHCINRPAVHSKTFTIHATAGMPSENWDGWFKGLAADRQVDSVNYQVA